VKVCRRWGIQELLAKHVSRETTHLQSFAMIAPVKTNLLDNKKLYLVRRQQKKKKKKKKPEKKN
jgi:hypothetical protein